MGDQATLEDLTAPLRISANLNKNVLKKLAPVTMKALFEGLLIG